MSGSIRELIRVLRMPCKEHAELLSRQLDAPLPRGQALGLRIHLLGCAGCRRFRRQLRRLRSLTRRLGDEASRGEGLPDAVRRRLMARVGAGSKKNW